MTDNPSQMGAPTKCTKAVTKAIEQQLAAGNWVSTACALAGITRRSFYNWMERGEAEALRIESGHEPNEDEAPYVDFFHTCARARATAEAESVIRIRLAGQGRAIDKSQERDWKADAWFLERAYPDRWGRRALDVKQEVQAKQEHIIDLAGLSDGALDELIDVLEQQADEQEPDA